MTQTTSPSPSQKVSAIGILLAVWRTLFAIAGVCFAAKFLLTIFSFNSVGLSQLNFADIIFLVSLILLFIWQWRTAKQVQVHWYTVISRIFGYIGFLTLILLFLFAEYSHFIYNPAMRVLTLMIYLVVIALQILPLKWVGRKRQSAAEDHTA